MRKGTVCRAVAYAMTDDDHHHRSSGAITLLLSAASSSRLPAHPALPPIAGPVERQADAVAGYPLPGTRLALLLRAKAPPPILAPIDPGVAPPDRPCLAFVAEFERLAFVLQPAPGTTVAATLRTGRLRAGMREAGAVGEPLHRLELSSRAGDPAAPWHLALALHRAEPLRLSVEPLAARGLRLGAGRPAEPLHARDPGLGPDVSVAQGLRRIVVGGVEQMLANEPAILAGAVEGVHQMRVALRQLRAGLRLFAPLLPDEAPDAFNARLRELGRVLGEARDWDVFCAETLPALAEADPGGWTDIEAAAEAERRRAHAGLAAHLASPEPTTLGLELAAWAEGWAPEADGRLAERAPALLHPLARAVRRRGRHVRHLAPEALHDLRKALKRLRYAADFLGALFPEGSARRFLRRCKALQEVLGTVNDAAMTGHLAAALGGGENPALQRLLAWNERRRRAALHALGHAWEQMREAEPFWE